jgi:DNA-directed RNA polymerase subunit RPC12/RpoP
MNVQLLPLVQFRTGVFSFGRSCAPPHDAGASADWPGFFHQSTIILATNLLYNSRRRNIIFLRAMDCTSERIFGMTEDSYRCPHCQQIFEIVGVRFEAFGTRIAARCPNCGLIPVEPRSTAGLASHFVQARTRVGSLSTKFKTITLMALAAILVAAILRHTLHVLAGISPGDIRSSSLLLICALGIVIVLFRIFLLRRSH